MKDWEFINSYIVSDSWISTLSNLTHIPFLGRLFHQYLFEHFSLSYDILVNFIEGHEEASHMIQQVILNKDFVTRILEEA